ncbi:MAG TPA: DUF5658 family protein [Bryobacteraceae bacterium]|nr:DUF5658 family protein [Bryobacteraceae bacterium]
MGLLALYATLQILDLITTMLFLSMGVQEGNPLVVQAIRWAGDPFQALVWVKLLAFLIGAYCWSAGRVGLLRRANGLFALLVIWNAVAIYRAAAQIS